MCSDNNVMLCHVLSVVRLKNRFRKPTPGGFRDFNSNLGISLGRRDDDGSEIWFNVELQIHLEPFVELDKANHSHEIYETFRTYFKVLMLVYMLVCDVMSELNDCIETISGQHGIGRETFAHGSRAVRAHSKLVEWIRGRGGS